MVSGFKGSAFGDVLERLALLGGFDPCTEPSVKVKAMTLVRIAWRNLWRHRRRTLITASGMAIAMGLVLSMACMQDGMFDLMADVMVRQTLGHAQVTHSDWPSKQLLYDTVPEALVGDLAELPEAVGASGRLFSYGLAASSVASVGARYVGLDPVRDRVVTDYSESLVRGRFIGDVAAGEIVIGDVMARELELAPGDEFVFLGQAADGSMANELLQVVGTYSTGVDQMDRAGAYVHLVDLQRLLALESQVHQVMLVASSLEASLPLSDAVKSAVAGQAQVLARSWEEADPQAAKMMSLRNVGLYIMLVITFSVAGLAVLNTMLMTVFERTSELGVLRAIGMTRLRMMLLVVLESVLLTAVATFFGLLLGAVLDGALLVWGLPYAMEDGSGLSWQGVTFPPVLKGTVRAEPIFITVGFVFVVAVLAAIWPALRAALLRPVEAMRHH